MKTDIHPKFYHSVVTCSCGNVFHTGATKPTMRVELCGKCHPFYTGKLKFIDTAGRIEKFQTKFASGSYASVDAGKPKKKPKPRKEEL